MSQNWSSDLTKRPGFVWDPIDRTDLTVANLATGFAIGFGLLTCRKAWGQVSRMRRPWKSIYVWLIVVEILSSIGYGICIYVLLMGGFKPNFTIFFMIAFVWTFQVQCLLQIICNRIAMIEMNRKRAKQAKWIVCGLVGLINISVFVIWIPAQMQISQTFIQLNKIWDRIEKCLYLLIDLLLNIYFIRAVKVRLVSNGLYKYGRLVKFNSYLIVVSISMDVLLVASMSLKNGLVYGTLHPVTYIVKLNIELSLAELITIIAREKSTGIKIDENERLDEDSTNATATMQSTSRALPPSYCMKCAVAEEENNEEDKELNGGAPVVVRRTQEVFVTSNTRNSVKGVMPTRSNSSGRGGQATSDESPFATGTQGWEDDGGSEEGLKGSYSVQVSGQRTAHDSCSSL